MGGDAEHLLQFLIHSARSVGQNGVRISTPQYVDRENIV